MIKSLKCCNVSCILTLILIEIRSIWLYVLPEHKTLILRINFNENLVCLSTSTISYVDLVYAGWDCNRGPSVDWTDALPPQLILLGTPSLLHPAPTL